MPTLTRPIPVDAPVSVPYRFGLFSVVTPRPDADQWRMGVNWLSQGCGQARRTRQTCGVDETADRALIADLLCSWASAAPFTVYAYNDEGTTDAPGDVARDHALSRLRSGEQEQVEAELWALMDAAVTEVDLSAKSISHALGYVEQMLAQVYGSEGVIHMSRLTATVLAAGGNLRVEGGRLVTPLSTPIVAGGGYDPMTADVATGRIYGTGPIVMYRGVETARDVIVNREVNNVSAVADRDYVIGWDCATVGVIAAV